MILYLGCCVKGIDYYDGYSNTINIQWQFKLADLAEIDLAYRDDHQPPRYIAVHTSFRSNQPN